MWFLLDSCFFPSLFDSIHFLTQKAYDKTRRCSRMCDSYLILVFSPLSLILYTFWPRKPTIKQEDVLGCVILTWLFFFGHSFIYSFCIVNVSVLQTVEGRTHSTWSVNYICCRTSTIDDGTCPCSSYWASHSIHLVQVLSGPFQKVWNLCWHT